MNKNELNNYLVKLGLTSDEALLYLSLIEKGEGTPLSISRATGINRTKVYRLLEQMQSAKLIVQEIDENGTRVSPAPVEHLQELLREKQHNIEELNEAWEEVSKGIEQISNEKGSETRVKFYRGRTGIEQMVWNSLKASSEIVGYTFRDLSYFVGQKFMEKFVAEFKNRNLRLREIYGDEYMANKHIDNNFGSFVNSRYLPKRTLAIPHQTDIYDDVVSFYSWNEGEVWGTEIYNEKVATMQKQLFELAWEKARKIDKN